MVRIETIEEKFACKLKKILHDEFVNFCDRNEINWKELLSNANIVKSKKNALLYVTYSTLLFYDTRLVLEWNDILYKIVIPYLLRYIKKLGVRDYRLLRDRFFRVIPWYVKILGNGYDSSLLYLGIKERLNNTQLHYWENEIYIKATNLESDMF